MSGGRSWTVTARWPATPSSMVASLAAETGRPWLCCSGGRRATWVTRPRGADGAAETLSRPWPAFADPLLQLVAVSPLLRCRAPTSHAAHWAAHAARTSVDENVEVISQPVHQDLLLLVWHSVL
jgi:hypothetical protein